MQFDFFATDDDLFEVVELLIVQEQCHIFEAYSRPDHCIREVRSAEDYAEIRREPGAVHLRGWSPKVTDAPEFRRFDLNPSIGRQRTALEGLGVVQLEGGRLTPNGLYAARLSHWNEAGARQMAGELADEVDWRALRQASGRIRRRTAKMAHGLLRNMPILKHAFRSFERGDFALWNFGESIRADSPLVTRLNRE